MIAHKYDEALADYWAAHASKGIGQRHYIAPNQKRLDEAVTYLTKTYGLDKEPATKPAKQAKTTRKKKAAKATAG